MRRLRITAWWLAPVVVIAWHYAGSGRQQLSADLARDQMRQANALEARGDAAEAAETYRQAAATLSDVDKVAQQRLRLAAAKAQVASGEIVEGEQMLGSLLSELERDPTSPAELTHGVRSALAETNYYAAYLMRREGAGPEQWLPEAEKARERFRLLAEQGEGTATDSHSVAAKNNAKMNTAKKNLEATIKLEQMDLSMLLAAPPPKKCPKCQNLCKRKKKSQNEQNSPEGPPSESNEPAPPEDIRKNIPHNGAGMMQSGGSGS